MELIIINKPSQDTLGSFSFVTTVRFDIIKLHYSIWEPWATRGYYGLKCVLSVIYTLDFEILMWKQDCKIPHFYIDYMLKYWYSGYTGLNTTYY